MLRGSRTTQARILGMFDLGLRNPRFADFTSSTKAFRNEQAVLPRCLCAVSINRNLDCISREKERLLNRFKALTSSQHA